MDAYSLLAEAIGSKQQVAARYHDRERIFSPHALGTKRSVAHVLVYQYAGGSETGLPPGGEWRCLNVEELSDLALFTPNLAINGSRGYGNNQPTFSIRGISGGGGTTSAWSVWMSNWTVFRRLGASTPRAVTLAVSVVGATSAGTSQVNVT